MNGIEAMVHQMSRAWEGDLKPRHRRIIDLSSTMSQREIAVELGMSRSTVQYVLCKAREQAGRQ